MTPEEGLLTFDVVVSIHDRAVRTYGGDPLLRDEDGLRAAIGAAANVFYVGYGDVFEVAAAYAFFIAERQAFMDGNKRTGIGAALRYLLTQGLVVPKRDMDLAADMLAIADKSLTRDGLTEHLRAWAVPMSTLRSR